MTRRGALTAIATVTAATLTDPALLLHSQQPCVDPGSAGTLLGTLPLSRPDGVVQPYGVKFGGPGLDARLVTDLSTLAPDRLITPTPLAFIRTDCPPRVAAHRGRWSIKTSGLKQKEQSLWSDDLMRAARPMGPHLIECSGNNNPANFGLMSVVEWDGVPLVDLVAQLRPASRATAVLIAGLDHDGQRSQSSTAGASWIFPLSSIDRLNAFLAVRMNGEPVPRDHGMPVRLVVPGWYACTWIKWVNEIRLVSADEPATSQMKEFAGRTHQAARHDLARDYSPAAIETAATPIRVEKRRDSNGIFYRIVGIAWGGTKPAERLAIRFGTADEWNDFSVCPAPRTHDIWSLWEYRWKPSIPGTYTIALAVPDSSVRQRRLDRRYYARDVKIDEV